MSLDDVFAVAPFTGAWIEILEEELDPEQKKESHPSRVRGLKYLPPLLQLP